eukprot:TRINITY_DN533_c0_g1_i3.p1 TRINITY_DN533_c0_g1~~TRINITY_DN533_c0_g1_i3.p1  ORF type:complete len:246 (+),score=45.12 TRINITY_DN533_c0_g1_i3:53-739(+)
MAPMHWIPHPQYSLYPSIKTQTAVLLSIHHWNSFCSYNHLHPLTHAPSPFFPLSFPPHARFIPLCGVVSKFEFDARCEALAMVSHDNRVKVWNSENGDLKTRLNPDNQLKNVYTCIAWGSSTNQKSGKKKKGKNAVEQVVGLGTEKGIIEVVSVSSGEVKVTLGGQGGGHTGQVNDLQFDPVDQDILWSCGSDKRLIKWNWRSGEVIKMLAQAHKRAINRLAVHPEGG